MATVQLANAFNSTMFTTCCNVAILDHEDRCPRCKEDVEPKGSKARWIKAYGPPGTPYGTCQMCGKRWSNCYC